MHALWPIAHPFAASLLLDPPARAGLALDIELREGAAREFWPRMLPGELRANPAARALELFAATLRHGRSRVELPYTETSHIAVEIDQ
jgi:hypothetical protein